VLVVVALFLDCIRIKKAKVYLLGHDYWRTTWTDLEWTFANLMRKVKMK